jgi:hypothetical protein
MIYERQRKRLQEWEMLTPLKARKAQLNVSVSSRARLRFTYLGLEHINVYI